MTDRVDDDDADLELPDLATGDDEHGLVDDNAMQELKLVNDGHDDPFDDSYADDVALEFDLATEQEEPTMIGDDAVGLDRAGSDDSVSFAEGGVSMIDEGRGHAEEGLDTHGDEELGIDPIPREVDDGGAEGLDDPAGSQVDEQDFPPLDGDDHDDDDEIDIGIELVPPSGTLDPM